MSFDAVAEVLRGLRLSDTCYWRGDLSRPWAIEIPGACGSSFHAVLTGTCYLRIGGREPLRLHAGDLVLLPHGRSHILSDSLDSAAVPADAVGHQTLGDNVVLIRHGGGGESTLIVGSTVAFEHPSLHPLIDVMPDVIHVPGAQDEGFHGMLAALGSEARLPRAGGTTVLTRIADALVIRIVRWWLEHGTDASARYFVALRDPQIGRALALIHRHPEKRWTVATLAKESHVSRSVFSERFSRLLGVPPMRYVTQHRMHLAARWLRDDHAAIGSVAMRLGYESEQSFSRAFRRELGVPPGALRRQRHGTTRAVDTTAA